MKRLPVYELRQTHTVEIIAADGSPVGAPVNGSAIAADILKALVNGAGVEEFWVLALNARKHVIACQKVSQGSLTQSLAHPREIFRIAIQLGAAGIIVGHNHPSGDSAPSPEDKAVTRRLRDAAELLALPLLDHVIVAENNHFSFADAGWPCRGI